MGDRLATRVRPPDQVIAAPSEATAVRGRIGFFRWLAVLALSSTTLVALGAADIDALWEYDDPTLSETRFRSALATATGDERLELLTQVARSLGLRGRFDDANHVLDEVAAALTDAGPRARVRYLLERGRTFNSSGTPERARPLFSDAWQLARVSGLDGLAVDAAHMMAITYGGGDAAIAWNRKGLDFARASTDPKARALIPAILNNNAWDLHDAGRYSEALPLFEEALKEWAARGKPAQIHIARWSVARCLRSLRRFSDALAIQLALERDDKAQGKVDGYVLEELAELYDALGQQADARSYFARAAAVLGEDPDFVKNEPVRLARLRSKGR